MFTSKRRRQNSVFKTKAHPGSGTTSRTWQRPAAKSSHTDLPPPYPEKPPTSDTWWRTWIANRRRRRPYESRDVGVLSTSGYEGGNKTRNHVSSLSGTRRGPRVSFISDNEIPNSIGHLSGIDSWLESTVIRREPDIGSRYETRLILSDPELSKRNWRLMFTAREAINNTRLGSD